MTYLEKLRATFFLIGGDVDKDMPRVPKITSGMVEDGGNMPCSPPNTPINNDKQQCFKNNNKVINTRP